MSLINHLKKVFFITLLSLFIGCQKESIEEPFDKSLYEGTFYCTIDDKYNGLGPAYTKSSYDQVVKVFVENDTIKFLNYKIPIDSLGQTVFNLGNSAPYAANKYSRSFTYRNNFENIYYYSYSSVSYYYSSSTNSSTRISGQRSLFSETTDEAPDSLKGDYLLTIREKDTSVNLDTQYVAVSYLTRNLGKIYADAQLISSFKFHSFYNLESFHDDYLNYRDLDISISWTPTNFSYKENTIQNIYQSADTIIKEYYGPRN